MIERDVDKREGVFKPRDLKEVLAFTKGLFAPGYIRYLLDYHKTHPERTIPLVFRENKVIKAICFFHFSTKEDGWLMGMRVRKDYQRKGIATTFTEMMLDYAGERGLSWIGLNTSFKNTSVHNISRRLEFVKHEAYYIYEFNPNVLKNIKQRKAIRLIEINIENTIEDYLKKGKIKKLLFVLDPGFIWIRITNNILSKLILEKNLYFYNNKLISLHKWGENIVFNILGKYNLSEYENFLAQFIKEYPEKSKGRIFFCIRKKDIRGISQLYNKISKQGDLKKYDIEKSDWLVYGKFLKNKQGLKEN